MEIKRRRKKTTTKKKVVNKKKKTAKAPRRYGKVELGLLKSLPVSNKREVVFEWCLNSGVVGGRRVTKKELAESLDLSKANLDKTIQTLERDNAKILSNSQSMRTQVLMMIRKAMNHIEKDRASALTHAAILENQIEFISKKIDETHKLPESRKVEKNLKIAEMNKWMYRLKMISRERIESLKTCFESTQAYTNFLELFASSGNPNGGKSMLSNAISEVEDPSALEENEEFLDKRSAIRILEDTGDKILPTQKFSLGDDANKNPNSGFEKLGDDPLEQE